MVCIGMWAGTAAAGTLLCHSRASFTGFPLRQVTGFFCIVREDSRLLADGRTRIPATLMTVSGRDGREADARGEVTIFVHSGVSFRQGERIKTSIPVIATERNRGGTDTSYLSFGGAGTLRSLGISDPLLRLRSTVLENIFRSTSGMGAAAGPLFRALFTGNQDTLDPAVVQLFRRSGCAHVLALSGMHLGILTALVGWFFSRILGRNAGYVLGLICVLIYLGVVGAKASLVRAGLMYAVAGYSVLRSRKPGGLATLALCFLIQLFCFPANGLTISFQLSYLALFGILLLAPTVVDALAPYITRGAAALVGAGVGAQLAVVPLVLVVFGTFYPVGIAGKQSASVARPPGFRDLSTEYPATAYMSPARTSDAFAPTTPRYISTQIRPSTYPAFRPRMRLKNQPTSAVRIPRCMPDSARTCAHPDLRKSCTTAGSSVS